MNALELFPCERLSAKLSVRACGSRFLRVKSATRWSQEYDSACDQCPVGEYHAQHGTRCPDTEETQIMGASNHTDEEQRAAVRRVLFGGEKRGDLAQEHGVTYNTISNWIRRWGDEVASEEIDERAAQAGKPTGTVDPDNDDEDEEEDEEEDEDEDEDEEEAVDPGPPKASARRPPPDVRAVTTEAPDETAPPRTQEGGPKVLVMNRAELARIGGALAAGVRHVAHTDTRHAMADAAWLLSEAGRG